MKKLRAGILAAAMILASGHAAWAACTVDKITGRSWFLRGLEVHVNATSFVTDTSAFMCPDLTLIPGAAPNTYKLKHPTNPNCSQESLSTSNYRFYTVGDTLRVAPQNCEMTGEFVFEFAQARVRVIAKILGGRFQKPQSAAKSEHGEFVTRLFVTDQGPTPTPVGSFSFTLTR